MRKHLCAFACAASLFVMACGGRQTMASKSARAFAEQPQAAVAATETQAPASPPATESAAPMDHSAHGGDEHAAMDHGTHAASEHAAMNHGDHTVSEHATMDHAAHTAAGHAAMDHSPHSAGEHANMDHGDHASMDHSAHAATPAPPRPAAPPTTARPQDTLKPDDFDAPRAESVAESQRAGGGAPIVAPDDGLYHCPMHPQVTSESPGKCPICGMTLVKKDKR